MQLKTTSCPGCGTRLLPCARRQRPCVPLVIYYAFKHQETSAGRRDVGRLGHVPGGGGRIGPCGRRNLASSNRTEVREQSQLTRMRLLRPLYFASRGPAQRTEPTTRRDAWPSFDASCRFPGRCACARTGSIQSTCRRPRWGQGWLCSRSTLRCARPTTVR